MLELKSVDAGYGTFQALFGVNLYVNTGEAVGVIGPNGAGKTTLMRVISGLIRPRSGAVAMGGPDVLNTRASHRRSRHSPRAREPPLVSPADGGRQPQDGRLHARGAGSLRRAAGVCVRPVSAHEGAPQPACGHLVGRRAADVRDRPRADVRSEIAAA